MTRAKPLSGLIVGNAVVAIVPLVLWLLADYLYVRGGEDPESLLLSPVLGPLFLGVVPLGLGYVNGPFLRQRSTWATVGLTLGVVVAASVLWFYVAYTLVVNFHLWIGGSM